MSIPEGWWCAAARPRGTIIGSEFAISLGLSSASASRSRSRSVTRFVPVRAPSLCFICSLCLACRPRATSHPASSAARPVWFPCPEADAVCEKSTSPRMSVPPTATAVPVSSAALVPANRPPSRERRERIGLRMRSTSSENEPASYCAAPLLADPNLCEGRLARFRLAATCSLDRLRARPPMCSPTSVSVSASSTTTLRTSLRERAWRCMRSSSRPGVTTSTSHADLRRRVCLERGVPPVTHAELSLREWQRCFETRPIY